MTNAEYMLTQERLLLVAHMVSNMDLDGFLERISDAETAAPILDLTLYIRGSTTLDAIKLIAQGARQFQKAIAQAKATLGEKERTGEKLPWQRQPR